MHASLALTLPALLLALAWTRSCAGRIPFPPPAPPSSAVPEGATWCNARPRFANGTARILPELAQAQAALGLNIIRFPSPASFEDWPNATTLQTCKYVAYAPFFADGLGSQYGRIIKIAAWAALHGVTYVHMPPEHIDHGVDPRELDRFFNVGEGEITPLHLPRGATVCLVDHCGPSTVQMAYMETAVAKMLRGSVLTMPPLPTYNHQRINIAIHIRRGDVTATQRYFADGRWVPDVFYVNLIRNLTRDLALHESPQFDFHIYSLGDPELFANITAGLVDPQWSEWWLRQPPPAPSPPTLPLPWLTASGSATVATQFRNPPGPTSTSAFSRSNMDVPPPPNIIWHLRDSEIDTVRGLICADIMVKAPGSLSAVSSWYSGAGVHITGGYPWNPQKHLEANYLPAMVGLLKQRLKARRFNRVGC